MWVVTNRKKIVLYTMCTLLFCLAGVFQATDSLLPDFWHVLFALSANTILIFLVVAWGVSLIHRMVRKDLLAYFLTVAVLILFFLVVRMMKYELTKGLDKPLRYFWYTYYVPQMFIPPTILLAAFSLENKKGKPLAKIWYLLYLPAIILIILIFTNEIHGWAFALNFDGDFSYKHRIVFYIALAWEIVVTFISLIVLILKCSVAACKKKMWVPVTAFIVCSAISTICFLTDTAAFKIPELICFSGIVVIESCITIGLIPTNEDYENYFFRSAYAAVITDEKFNVVYNSENSIITDKKLFQLATKTPIMIDKSTRLSAVKINGGWSFRLENLARIIEINNSLAETNERLSEENYIIEAENELKKQKTQIAEQKRLYTKINVATREELKKLSAVLSSIDQKKSFNDTEYIAEMRFACILAAYIKRRSNIVMLTEKHKNIDLGELSLAIKESLDYISLTGAECSYDCSCQGKIDGKKVGVLYDFFEECINNYYNLPKAIIVRLCNQGNDIILRIESDSGKDAISNKIKSKFSEYNVSVETDDEEVYYSLLLHQGGAI